MCTLKLLLSGSLWVLPQMQLQVISTVLLQDPASWSQPGAQRDAEQNSPLCCSPSCIRTTPMPRQTAEGLLLFPPPSARLTCSGLLLCTCAQHTASPPSVSVDKADGVSVAGRNTTLSLPPHISVATRRTPIASLT